MLEVRPAPPPPSVLVPEDVPIAVRYEDEHLLVVDKPAGMVTHPSAGHARRHARPRPSRPTPSPAATIRRGRASCTASTATPRGLLVVARSRARPPPPAAAAARSRRWTAATWRSCTGPRRPALTIDRPDRPRPPRTAPAWRSTAAEGRPGGHPPAPPGGAGPLLPARGPPRDRAHPPDPRAPGVGGPPGGGRPRLRPPRGDAGPGAPVPPRRPAGLPPSRDGRADRGREPAPARTSQPPSTGPGAAGARGRAPAGAR